MDPFTLAMLASGGANLLKGGFGLFGHHGQKNPADVANKRLDQIPGQTKPYYDPYINAGRDSLEKLKEQYGQLSEDPGKRFAELGAGYTHSPGYEATLREAVAGANNAAVMGGAPGTYRHQQMAAGAAGDVANKDYEQYIKHIMELYGIGLKGEGDINQQGFDASKNQADILGQITGQKAAYDYAGQDWKNQQNSQDWTNIASGASQIGTSYMYPQIKKYYDSYNQGGH